MTGQDILDRVDALVVDLQTRGKGQTVNVVFRSANNETDIYTLSSNAAGVINAQQLRILQDAIATANLVSIADDYTASLVPIQQAADNLRTAEMPHESLALRATQARKALSDAYFNDPAYQTAKMELETARLNPDYIAARTAYDNQNVSENYAALGNAKGEYIL